MPTAEPCRVLGLAVHRQITHLRGGKLLGSHQSSLMERNASSVMTERKQGEDVMLCSNDRVSC